MYLVLDDREMRGKKTKILLNKLVTKFVIRNTLIFFISVTGHMVVTSKH